ncbi:M14 family zinc carboxypeptidase [Fredinandcohnia sp. 179-A 10B2 NHS]|uniref:M14 family zinc carboxypeptidase n=1 Tax=Fredinandcohnia sp. 179-A 10B2 NHS TaxID=3235176 RepID=UPI0039A3ECE5
MYKKLWKLILVTVVISNLFVFTSYAKTNPNGPWVTPNQHVSLERMYTPEELEKELKNIEARSNGRMTLEVAGTTQSGYPIYVAKIGDNDPNKKGVLIQSTMHGDEELGVISSVELIKTLVSSNNPEVQKMRDNLSVWVVPMLNPEGVVGHVVDGVGKPLRYNRQAWTPGEWGLEESQVKPWYHRATGYDINRDFNPDLEFELNPSTAHLLPGQSVSGWRGSVGFFVTPEARAMVDLYEALEPELFIDLHHTYPTYTVSEDSDEMSTLAILNVPIAEEGYTDREDNFWKVDDEVVDLSKRIGSLVYQKLQVGNSHFGNVSRYEELNVPAMAISTFALNGTPTMLYEIRGGSNYDTGQKASGMMIKQTYDGLYETLKGFVTGEVYQADPAVYDSIPVFGPVVDNPHEH